VRAAVESFFDSILGLSHSIDRTLGEGNTLVCEGEVTYTRHDGRIVVVPFVDVFEYEGEQIAEYKIYIDISPLYAD
jgi:limonene-1,2-epoxide hydrolase